MATIEKIILPSGHTVCLIDEGLVVQDSEWT